MHSHCLTCSVCPEPGSGAEWPRAVIFDFECDPNAGVGKPLSVVEFPAYTYAGKLLSGWGEGRVCVLSLLCRCVVRWPSAFACPVPISTTSCPLQQFDGTWSVSLYTYYSCM